MKKVFSTGSNCEILFICFLTEQYVPPPLFFLCEFFHNLIPYYYFVVEVQIWEGGGSHILGLGDTLVNRIAILLTDIRKFVRLVTEVGSNTLLSYGSTNMGYFCSRY